MKLTLLLPGLLAFAFAVVLAQIMPDLVDVRQYGAREVDTYGSYRTTATGSAESKVLNFASDSIFQNNDGIVVYGGGSKPAISAPAAPEVTAGISETETVPYAQMTIFAAKIDKLWLAHRQTESQRLIRTELFQTWVGPREFSAADNNGSAL